MFGHEPPQFAFPAIVEGHGRPRFRVRGVSTTMIRALLPALSIAALATTTSAQVAPGFRMFGPHGTTDTFLIDTAGVTVHTWPSTAVPGNGMYLEPDGTLVRSLREPGGPTIGGTGGRVSASPSTGPTCGTSPSRTRTSGTTTTSS